MDKERIKELWDKVNIFVTNKLAPLLVDVVFITLAIRIAIIKNSIWSAIGYFVFVNFIVAIATMMYIFKGSKVLDISNMKDDITRISIILCPYFLIFSVASYYLWIY